MTNSTSVVSARFRFGEPVPTEGPVPTARSGGFRPADGAAAVSGRQTRAQTTDEGGERRVVHTGQT